MRFRPAHLVAVLALGLAFTGCGFTKPTLKFKTANLRDTTLEGTTLDLVYTLKNPNPIGIKLASVKYALDVEGKSVASGKPRNGMTVGAKRQTDITFPATIKFVDLYPVLQTFLQKDQASYKASGEIGIDTPIGVIKLPLSYSSVFPIPKLPSVEFQAPVIKSIALTGAQVVFPIRIGNGNGFPLPLGAMKANFAIAGANVGSANLSALATLAPGGSQVIEVPLNVNFLQSGTAVANALRTKTANVKLSGSLDAGGFAMPLDMQKNLNFR